MFNYLPLKTETDLKIAALLVPGCRLVTVPHEDSLVWRNRLRTETAYLGDVLVQYPSGDWIKYEKKEFDERYEKA